jgi:hypothetical protein
MVTTTLALSALFAFAAASLYAYVGWRLSRRRVSAEARTASLLFTVWWYGLAGTTVLSGIQALAASLGSLDLPLAITSTYVSLLLICLALWGLLFYLVYVFTGSNRALWPLTALYIAYYMMLVYYVTAGRPNGIEVRRWGTALAYETPFQGLAVTIIIVLLLAPQILGALAYLTLYFRVKERTQRYRVALVSLSILVWFGSSFVASNAGLSSNDSWQVASKFIGLAAATTILFAYVPPAWIQRRYGIQAVDAPPAEAAARLQGAG